MFANYSLMQGQFQWISLDQKRALLKKLHVWIVFIVYESITILASIQNKDHRGIFFLLFIFNIKYVTPIQYVAFIYCNLVSFQQELFINNWALNFILLKVIISIWFRLYSLFPFQDNTTKTVELKPLSLSMKMSLIVTLIASKDFLFYLALVVLLMIGDGSSCRSAVLDRSRAHIRPKYIMVNFVMV